MLYCTNAWYKFFATSLEGRNTIKACARTFKLGRLIWVVLKANFRLQFSSNRAGVVDKTQSSHPEDPGSNLGVHGTFFLNASFKNFLNFLGN